MSSLNLLRTGTWDAAVAISGRRRPGIPHACLNERRLPAPHFDLGRVCSLLRGRRVNLDASSSVSTCLRLVWVRALSLTWHGRIMVAFPARTKLDSWPMTRGERQMAFHVGDIVQLTYGSGVRMRVEKVATSNGNEWVTCVWGENDECHNYFLGDTLQTVESKAAPKPTSAFAELWKLLAFWRPRQT
jgi:uncharacterized protein YodC (DUF2158 family)